MGNRDADDDRDRDAKDEQEERDEKKKDPYEDVASTITFNATTSAMLNP